MRLTAIALLFLTQTTIAQDANELLTRCLKDSEVEMCQVATSMYNGGLNRPDLALQTSEKACELDHDACSQVYYSAMKAGKKVADAAFERMKSRCEKDAGYCNELAYIYKDRKEPALALAAAKKYYDKYKKGYYIWLAYHAGDKKLAWDEGLANCRTNNSTCASALASLPDHPQFQELMDITESYCKAQIGTPNQVAGYSCANVAANYYFKGNIEKAQEYYSLACYEDALSCYMLMGASDFGPAVKLRAYQSYCKSTQHFVPDIQMQKKYCKGDLATLPRAITKESYNYAAKYVIEAKKKKLRELAEAKPEK